MKNKVIPIVSKITKINPEILEKESTSKLWDSLKHLEIIFALEEAFSVSFELSDIADMRSIDAIVEVLIKTSGE